MAVDAASTGEALTAAYGEIVAAADPARAEAGMEAHSDASIRALLAAEPT